MVQQLIVAGERRDAIDGETFTVTDPSTGDALTEVAKAGPADVDAAVAVAHAAFADGQGAWARTNATERGRVIHRVAELLRERIDGFAEAEARGAGHPKQAHQAPGIARQQLLERRIDQNSSPPGEDLGDEADLPLLSGREHELVVQPAAFIEKLDQRRAERFDAALGVVILKHIVGRLGELEVRCRRAPRGGKIAAQARCNRVNQMLRACLRQIVEGDQALAEAIAAAAAGEDQRHRRRGDRAIIMADQALEDARFAPPASCAGRRRDPLLIRPAQQQRHEAGLVEQAGGSQHPHERGVTLIVGGNTAARQLCANGVGDVADQAMQHRRHQRPLLLGQAVRGIEEEVAAYGREAAPPRRARGAVPVSCRCSNGPFLRHHVPASSGFRLNWRQLVGV